MALLGAGRPWVGCLQYAKYVKCFLCRSESLRALCCGGPPRASRRSDRSGEIISGRETRGGGGCPKYTMR
eukprot:5828116-Prymnesium_polylepis.1